MVLYITYVHAFSEEQNTIPLLTSVSSLKLPKEPCSSDSSNTIQIEWQKLCGWKSPDISVLRFSRHGIPKKMEKLYFKDCIFSNTYSQCAKKHKTTFQRWDVQVKRVSLNNGQMSSLVHLHCHTEVTFQAKHNSHAHTCVNQTIRQVVRKTPISPKQQHFTFLCSVWLSVWATFLVSVFYNIVDVFVVCKII